MQIGFIGLGLMGRPMALNLARAGYKLHLWARRPESLKPFAEQAAQIHLSPALVAQHADVIFTMVADSADVEDVLLGKDGVVHGGRAGQIVIDMSTIAPAAAIRVAAGLARRGIEFVDAPVSGGESGAIHAQLTIMAGGRPEVFKRVESLLTHLGRSITLIGAVGAGQIAKACNQIITSVGVAALAEAINFARKSGVDAARMREVLLGGFAASRILEMHGQRMLERNFAPGFKAWMHQKDLRIVLQTAHDAGLALPTAAAALQLYNALLGSGMGELDTTALLQVFERMSGGECAPTLAAGAASLPVIPSPARRLKVGFIGLGVMGAPMARHLLAAGHTLGVWARRAQAAQELVAAGAQFYATPAELARQCEVVFTIVTSSADVEAVALGEYGLIHGFEPGSILVDMSTIAPEAARRIAAALHARGVHMLDAPVSGGGLGAQNATLAIMAGGADEAFARVRPLFETLGKTIVHVGASGAGQVVKACNQMVMVAALQALAEAASLAAGSGVDFAKVYAAVKGGSAGSRVLEFFGDKMLRRDFAAGIEARLHQKDYALIMDHAARVGAPLPISAQVWQQLNALMALGWGKDDTSNLLRVLESLRAPVVTSAS